MALGGTKPQSPVTTSSVIVIMPLVCPEEWQEPATVLPEGTHVAGANSCHPHGHSLRSE